MVLACLCMEGKLKLQYFVAPDLVLELTRLFNKKRSTGTATDDFHELLLDPQKHAWIPIMSHSTGVAGEQTGWPKVQNQSSQRHHSHSGTHLSPGGIGGGMGSVRQSFSDGHTIGQTVRQTVVQPHPHNQHSLGPYSSSPSVSRSPSR